MTLAISITVIGGNKKGARNRGATEKGELKLANLAGILAPAETSPSRLAKRGR
jgi:hypothetical protein